MGGRNPASRWEAQGRPVSEAVVDANVLLRHLTGAPAELAARALAVLTAAEKRNTRMVVAALTLAEVVFVLQHSYRWQRREIAERLTRLIDGGTFHLPEGRALRQALVWYREQAGIHFADAYVAAVAAERGAPVMSFDRALKRARVVTVIDSAEAFER